MDVICVKITKQRLRCRTHAQTFLKRFQSSVCDPCYFRRKAFHMVLFFLKQAFWNKHRQVNIFYPCLFKPAVQLMLDILPDGITCRFDDHTAFYTGIIDELCFFYHICIPLREIFFHRSDRFYKFLFFCHDIFLLLLHNAKRRHLIPKGTGIPAVPPLLTAIAVRFILR